MSVTITIPPGMFGKSKHDSALVNMLRALALKASSDRQEWCDKYGTDYENEVFMMHPFCWCEKSDCAWCGSAEERKGAPNFWYKPTDLKVWWYKYIGRGMEASRALEIDEINTILSHCLSSMKK